MFIYLRRFYVSLTDHIGIYCSRPLYISFLSASRRISQSYRGSPAASVVHEPTHLVAVRDAAKPPSIRFELAVLNKDIEARSSESFLSLYGNSAMGQSMCSTSVIIATNRLFDE